MGIFRFVTRHFVMLLFNIFKKKTFFLRFGLIRIFKRSNAVISQVRKKCCHLRAKTAAGEQPLCSLISGTVVKAKSGRR